MGRLCGEGVRSYLERSRLVPERVSDAGVRDSNLEVWTALVGPARLPQAAQSWLSAEVPHIIRQADTRQKLFNQGWQAVGISPDGLRSRIKDESAVMGRLIAVRGIALE